MGKKNPLLTGIFIGLLIGFLFSGLILFLAAAPKGSPIVVSLERTQAVFVFEIYGAVNKPGIYNGNYGMIVNDAVLLAGGLKADADEYASNLSAKVNPGDRIIAPTKSSYIITTTPVSSRGDMIRINLNSADIESLMKLPGIGEKKARDIIAYRESVGKFNHIDELLNIPGIGESTLRQFYDQITTE